MRYKGDKNAKYIFIFTIKNYKNQNKKQKKKCFYLKKKGKKERTFVATKTCLARHLTHHLNLLKL